MLHARNRKFNPVVFGHSTVLYILCFYIMLYGIWFIIYHYKYRIVSDFNDTFLKLYYKYIAEIEN